MKLLAGMILTLFLSVWVALSLREEPGYVMFSMGEWTVETSLAFFVICLVLLFVVLYIAVRFLVRLWQTPAQTLGAHHQRLQRKAQRLLDLGQRQIAAGQWEAAENTLLKGASCSATPAAHYMAAARAVHHLQDAKWRRDLHLRRAEAAPAADTLAVRLMQSEFLLEDQDAAEAKAILESLHTLHPRHPGVLHWLAKTYQQLAAWEQLQPLLPEVQRHKAMSTDTFATLQAQTYRALLESAAAGGSLEKLRNLWRQTPANLREGDEELLVAYATALCEAQAIDDAETLLREALQRHWSAKLVVGYGMLGRGNAPAQLATAEGWLTQHGEDAYLLLTLGRLAKRCQQDIKARNYLERSIQIMPTPDAYQELGELLSSQHELTYAGQCFHAGLRLLVGKPQEQSGAMLPATDAAQQLQAPATS